MSVRTGSPPHATLVLGTPVPLYNVIQEGPFATVARAWTKIKDGITEWIVVKSATTHRKFAREPHDIVKELRVLSTVTHPNIVYLLGSFRDEDQSLLSIYMPYLPMSLASLLASPRFSPYPFPPTHGPSSPMSGGYTTVQRKTSPELQIVKFTLMARSILAQALEALAFLHDPVRSVGHRDIKPENIMLTDEGCVKLIDFGVAWKEKENDLAKSNDLWPEYKGKLYFQVSTRAYRAPELLFGSRHYDHLAIDLWSIGVTFAEFFMSLRLHGKDDEGDEGDEDDNAKNDTDISPFVIPRYLRIGYPGSHWRRDSLFDGQRGEIGLAWSIFKILGTPNSSNWPDFKHLPGASSVAFKVVPGVPLRPLLANLPPSASVDPMLLDQVFNYIDGKATLFEEECEQQNIFVPVSPLSSPTLNKADIASASSETATEWTSIISASEGEQEIPSILDLLRRFLVYPAAARLRAGDALRHPWFLERLDGRPTTTGMSANIELGLPPSATPGAGHSYFGKVQAVAPSSKNTDAGPISSHELILNHIDLGNDIEEKIEVSPLLLLPLGYVLESSPPGLKSISVNTWCGLTLGDLLRDVIGDPRNDL